MPLHPDWRTAAGAPIRPPWLEDSGAGATPEQTQTPELVNAVPLQAVFVPVPGRTGPPGVTNLAPQVIDRHTATASTQQLVLTLSHTPLPGFLHVEVNGLTYRAPDWTLDGRTLTLTYPHTDAGDEIAAVYLTQEV